MNQYVRKNGAFTLVELLVVVSLLVFLMSLVVPAATSMMQGMNLTRLGQETSDQISLARRLATTRKSIMEVRFIKGDETVDGYTAMQLWESDGVGNESKAAGKLISLSPAVMVSGSLSPLLENADASAKGTATFKPLGSKPYASIRIRPNGRLVSSQTLADSYILLCARKGAAAKPVNYFAIQISPLTGRVTPLRP